MKNKFIKYFLINFAFCLIVLPILERIVDLCIPGNRYIFNSSLHLLNSFNWALLLCIGEMVLVRKKAMN